MKKYIAMTFVVTTFFLSGACGLVYEMLWTRYLGDLMGSTSLSELVVLMVFMGGLSLGALLVGGVVDRRGRGLWYYGLLELGVGLYAVLFPVLFENFSSLFTTLVAGLPPGSISLLLFKLLGAVLLIFFPAVVMGGTLPAVTRYLTTSQGDLRRNISLLYGVNCLGAVVGVITGGFFIVHFFGLAASMIYTGYMNISLGIAAIAVSWWADRKSPAGLEAEVAPPQRRLTDRLDGSTYRPYAVKRAIAAAGISGFAAMALQVAWIRYFAIVLGATHSAFTIVVAAFIFGLGLGALLVSSRLIGRLPLPTVLTSAFAITSMTLVVDLFFYGLVPFEIGRYLQIIAHIPLGWPFYQIMRFGICFVLMLLPAAASGMILPICVRIAGQGIERVGRDVARVYAVNTLGALLGIVVTQQIFFRVLTLSRTLQVILAIYLVSTIFLAFILKERGRKTIFALTTLLVLVHLVYWQPWLPQQLFVTRLDFGGDPPLQYADFAKVNKENVLVAERQDPEVQAVTQDTTISGYGVVKTLFINGKPDASDDLIGPDIAHEVLLAHLPMLLNPDAKNVFVLGLGSGISTGEVLRFPGVERVTTAELSGAVFAASKDFAASNGRYWENPKHRTVIDDGKTVLQHGQEKYDAIIMQPTNVWQEGMAGLFSEEFFRLAKSRLHSGGVVAQWMQLYKVDDRTVNIILKTFSQVFPEASVFMLNPVDVLLVGYDEGWRFDPDKMQRLFAQPQVLAAQKKINNATPESLLLREILSRNDFREYTVALNANINTTDFPVLEQAAEYGQFISERVTLLAQGDSRLDPDGKGLLIKEYLRRFSVEPQKLPALAESPAIAENDRLRQSLNLWYLNEIWGAGQESPPDEALALLYDPQLREIVMHPYYRREVERLTGDDALNLLGAELIIWDRAATQFWTPEPQRLYELYDRFAAGIDRENGGKVARNAALFLARGRACGEALHFFRIAEAKGQLDPAMLQPAEIAAVFSCEVKEGEAIKARNWWREIEQRQMEVTAAMQREKTTLDIKLGGDPPPPVYGRLPSLW
jgi:spermidine synthase